MLRPGQFPPHGTSRAGETAFTPAHLERALIHEIQAFTDWVPATVLAELVYETDSPTKDQTNRVRLALRRLTRAGILLDARTRRRGNLQAAYLYNDDPADAPCDTTVRQAGPFLPPGWVPLSQGSAA